MEALNHFGFFPLSFLCILKHLYMFKDVYTAIFVKLRNQKNGNGIRQRFKRNLYYNNKAIWVGEKLSIMC